MTKERAIEIINIAIPNPIYSFKLAILKGALIESAPDGLTEFELLQIFMKHGVDVEREEVFDALFLERFKKFVSDHEPTPTTAS